MVIGEIVLILCPPTNIEYIPYDDKEHQGKCVAPGYHYDYAPPLIAKSIIVLDSCHCPPTNVGREGSVLEGE